MSFLESFSFGKLLLIVLSSFAVCTGIVLTQRWHGKHSLDHDLNGAQKLHRTPVPRIGGLALFMGLMVAVATSYFTQGITYPLSSLLAICALPVFFAGFLEDLTKSVSVRMRLLASFASAALAVWLLGAQLPRLDVPWLDVLFQTPFIAAIFTVFAVGGVTHSINIIDGLNGLAAGAVSIMLTGLGLLAWLHGDVLVMKLTMAGVCALIGFMLLNYPFGKIFLGDGGAYLAGFWLAECAVLLLARNPEVSPWTVLLCCLYPVLETGYSMYRRHVVHKVSSGLPDMGHMHQLLFKCFEDLIPARRKHQWLNHGFTSLNLWVMVAACQLAAIATPDSTGLHIVLIALASWFYISLHRALWQGQENDDTLSAVA